MKKFMYFALSCAVMVGATGCGSQEPAGETTTNSGTETNTNTDSTSDGGSEEPTQLTYLAWDVGTEEDPSMERVMVEIYDEAHPEIEVEILAVPEGTDYNSYIATLASSGQMADVFMWGSVSEAILNGWAADVTEYANSDEEYKMINPATREGGQAGGQAEGGIYGIPKAMHYMGMYINKDIFAANNVEPLQYGYTMEDMMNAIEKNTTSTTKGVDNFAVEAWYPLTQNPAYGFYTHDGSQVHMDSEEFAKGVEYAQQATTNNWNMVNTTPLDFFGTEGWAWGEIGGIALQYDATWNLASLANTASFEYDYIGLPGGHTVLINDYIFVSEASEDKAAAYDLAKWMSYSVDGTLERFSLAEGSDTFIYNAIPLITTSDEINERYLATVQDYPEFIKAYESLGANPDLLHVEGYKEIPGFPTAVFSADTGVQGTNEDGTVYSMTIEQLRQAIIRGEFKLADYASKMNEIANLEFTNARTQVEEATK